MFKTILIFSLLLPAYTFSADEKSQALVEILKDDEVNALYTGTCKIKKEAELEACLWDGLSDEKKKELSKKLSSLNAGSKSSKTQYDALNLSSGLKTEGSKNKDPAIAKLENYLSERFAESLYGEIKGSVTKNTKVVDHKVFYELYETQVSKSVVSAISSYCVEADSESKPKFKVYENTTTASETRAKNIKALTEDIKTTEGKLSSAGSATWGACSVSIQDICSKFKDYEKIDDYSQKRACVVTKLIKEARQNLIKITQIKKAMEENNKQSGTTIQTSKSQEVYSGASSPDGKTKDVDELTTLTSSDLAKSGFEEGNTEKKKLYEECAQTPEQEKCKDIIWEGKEAENAKKNAAEYALRTKALEEKLSNDETKFSNEEVKNYLKEQGHSDEEIKKMTTDNAQIQKIREEIQTRYKNEREALVKAMNDKLQDKTATVPQDKQSKIAKLSEEIQGRPEIYKDLIHYNNIVAGFLSFESKGNNKSEKGNTVSITRELSNTEGLSAEKQTEYQKLKAEISGKTKLEEKSSISGVGLEVENINNSILKIDAASTPTP